MGERCFSGVGRPGRDPGRPLCVLLSSGAARDENLRLTFATQPTETGRNDVCQLSARSAAVAMRLALAPADVAEVATVVSPSLQFRLHCATINSATQCERLGLGRSLPD